MGRSKQSSTQEMQMPQFQQDYLQNTVIPFAENIANTPFTPYTGQMVAQFSPLALGAQQYYQNVGDISTMTPQQYAAMTSANMNPYQTDVINAAVNRMNRERAVARTGEMADITQARAFGNDRRAIYEAERQAQYELGRDQMIADLMAQGYSQAQAATMAQLQQRQGAALAAAQGQTQLGTMEQATEQAALEAAYNEFLREQQNPLMQLGALQGAAGVIPGGYGTTTQVQSSGGGFSGVLGAVGALGQGLGAMGVGFPSDRRLKKNITPLAEINGVKYYTWEWNDAAKAIGAGDMPRSGVIADELKEIHPDLVYRGDDGYLRVDYAGLNERQKEFA
jgi:hypothetical protein